MVPYVRKSFYKHWKDGRQYCGDILNEQDDERYCDYLNNNSSIEDDYYKNYPKAYKYAMDMTIKEIRQAVEGMYHNLNTLQSRSGNQLKMVAG